MRRNNVTRNDNTRHKKLRKLVASQRALSRVAKELGLSRTHVNYVARGIRSSKKVEDALLREIDRIDSESAA